MLEGKRLFASIREAAKDNDEQLAASQKYGVFPQALMMRLNDSKVMLALKGTSSFRHVEKNDFVISLRSFEGGIEHSSYTGCVSPAYTVLRGSEHVAPSFFRLLLKSGPFVSALQASTDSLRDGKSISYEQFGSLPLLCPPLPEQIQIAKFLDYETAKIDELIEKQQELIALLKEKRQAVISHAVTKGLPPEAAQKAGLNPHPPLKDSGIEWLGEVPEHWDTLPLKFLLIGIEQGKSPDCEARLALPNEWGVLKSGCINRGVFNEDEHKTLPKTLRPLATAEVKTGDLLMSRASGSKDLIGSVGLVEQVRPKLMLSDKIFRLKPTTQALPSFIWRAAGSTPLREQIELSINGAEGLANNITKDSIKGLFFACPPMEEQRLIVEYLEQRLLKFKELEDSAEAQITLLQERRTALISAAVTGKIDVRDWQPPSQAT
ncbi:hypothetical protein AAFN60_14525 [Roseibacillus persicicus]|uniref:restriction endonuclease subunit S n=1 Tax=Roseibacillus persicicus TaxID=454148 RepID=UPI00398AD446